MEYKFKVGDRVTHSDENEDYFEAEIVAIDSGDGRYPYLLEANISEELWDFFEAADLEEDYKELFPDYDDDMCYAWAGDDEIQLISSASKYDLKRTTFLEGVEL